MVEMKSGTLPVDDVRATDMLPALIGLRIGTGRAMFGMLPALLCSPSSARVKTSFRRSATIWTARCTCNEHSAYM